MADQRSNLPPFMKAQTQAAPQATPQAAPQAATPKAGKAEAVERKAPAKAMTPEQIQQVIALVKDHTYAQIAEKLGITKFQVNRVLMELKANLRKQAKGNPEKEAKVEKYIKEYLSRPEESRPGVAGPKGGKVKTALNSIVDNIMAGL